MNSSIVEREKKLTHHIARKTFETTVLLFDEVFTRITLAK